MGKCSKCWRVNDREGQRYCRSCHRAYMRRWRPPYSELSEEDKAKSRCRAIANVAQGRGKLVKQPCCVCGTNENVEKHHEDYTKPLEVDWLCRSCHKVIHL